MKNHLRIGSAWLKPWAQESGLDLLAWPPNLGELDALNSNAPLAWLRYPPRSLVSDYARAIIGVGLCGFPLAAFSPAIVVAWILGGLTALFFSFGLHTAWRQGLRFALGDAGLWRKAPGLQPRLYEWANFNRLDLRFFPTRRDRSQGWLQLTLKGPGGKLRIESNLEDFDRLAQRAAHEAETRDWMISEGSRDNLDALSAHGFGPGSRP